LILTRLATPEGIVAYGLAYRLPDLVLGMVGWIGAAFVRGLVTGTESAKAYAIDVQTWVFLACGAIAAGSALLGESPIVRLIGGGRPGVSAVFVALVPIVVVSATNNPLARAALVNGGARRFLIIGVVATAANVVGCLVLIPRFGAVGAARVSTATESAGLVVSALMTRSLVKGAVSGRLCATMFASTVVVSLASVIAPLRTFGAALLIAMGIAMIGSILGQRRAVGLGRFEGALIVEPSESSMMTKQS
jgi:O-antigen/teichoic acid export membrane protein